MDGYRTIRKHHIYGEGEQHNDKQSMLALRIANDGLWEWNLGTDHIHLSPRGHALLGCYEVDISPGEWFSHIHPDDLKGFVSKIIAHLYQHIPYVEHEYRLCRKDGSHRWILCRGIASRDEHGQAYYMAGSLTDISERKEYRWAIDQLRRNASQDTLTFLPNRSTFMRHLDYAFDRVQQKPRSTSSQIAVMLIDLDRFKVINNSLGFTIGDQILTHVARRIEQLLKGKHFLARVGNDEFTILFENMTVDMLQTYAHRIQQEIRIPFHIQGYEIFTTISIGIAQNTPLHKTSLDIMRDADTAIHRAKLSGGGRCEMFDTTMHAHVIQRMHLETELRRAIKHHEFCVFYQPIISLQTGRIVAFEALVRWKHPQRGMLEPAMFIGLAEETGMIKCIDRWVLHTACKQLRRWQNKFPAYSDLSISVNLSSKQFSQPDLIEYIDQTLATIGLDSRSLNLEITESVIMENTELSMNILTRLQSLHIRLKIDDFGTGYSSLSYLHRFPTQELKIDRSFVSRINGNDESKEIIRTIVTLANNLKMDTIAEGVETYEQLDYIRTMECDYAQGFLFSRPVAQEQAEALLASHPYW